MELTIGCEQKGDFYGPDAGLLGTTEALVFH